MGYVRGAIKQEVNSKFDKKIKIEKIKKIVNDRHVRDALKSEKIKSYKRLIYDFFIKIRCYNILYILSKRI